MNAIAKLPLRQVQNVQQLLKNDMARDQLAAVAAKHMSPERMMRVVANAIRTTPKLQECEPLSFLGALMQCASLGLEPQTVLGHAYLVPFKNNKKGVTEVQVIVGYKGLIDLARRSGHITSISANVHYSDDDMWDWEEGTDARLRHRPGPQEGEKLHAYAIAKFKDGGFAYVVLPWAHIMKIRNGSQNWQSAVKFNSTDKNPWSTHEDAMAKKTAIRALAKYLPLSVEFMDAVQIDHDAGSRVDYAAMAIDPTSNPDIEEGITIDGTAEVPDEGPLTEEETKADKPASKPKADAKKADAKPKPEPKKEPEPKAKEPDPEPEPEQEAAGEPEAAQDGDDEGEPPQEADDGDQPLSDEQQKLYDLLREELDSAKDQGAVETVQDIYGDELERQQGTPGYATIMELFDEARERLAK